MGQHTNTEPESTGPGFEHIYDPATVQAIDMRGPQPDELPGSAGKRLASRALGHRIAGGALAAGMMRGVAEALDEDPEEEAILEVLDEERSTLQPVSIFLVPGNPAASVAVVRPWLFPIAQPATNRSVAAKSSA